MSRQSLITLNYYLAFFFLTTIPICLSFSQFQSSLMLVLVLNNGHHQATLFEGGGTFNKLFRHKLRGFCLLCWVEKESRLPTKRRRVFFLCHSLDITGKTRRITLETSRVKESKQSVSCLCYVPRGVDNTLTIYFVSFILKFWGNRKLFSLERLANCCYYLSLSKKSQQNMSLSHLP